MYQFSNLITPPPLFEGPSPLLVPAYANPDTDICYLKNFKNSKSFTNFQLLLWNFADKWIVSFHIDHKLLV